MTMSDIRFQCTPDEIYCNLNDTDIYANTELMKYWGQKSGFT